MEMIAKRVKFMAIVFIGMISLLFIYERVCYNNYIYHYINRSTHNSIVINSNNFDSNSSKDNNKIIRIKSIYKSDSPKEYSEYSVSNRSEINYFDKQYYLLKTKVLEFESKYLVPMKKWSKNSKLLYTDVVKQITEMRIGDQKCDNNYGNELNVVIVIISRVNGFTRRQIIRETWAQRIPESKDIKLYFAIGLSSNSETQEEIVIENKRFNDLLQWNFVDNYYNLTIKSLAILRWVSLNCFKTKFLYKVDDDCIVNTDNLVQFSKTASLNTIYGHLWKKAFVDRQMSHKFFISKSDYKPKSYPDYTGGPWLMSSEIVPLLYETAITKSLPALPYEDVYITGLVASKSGVARKQLSGLIYFDHSMFNKVNYCMFRENIIFWQNLDDLMITNIWRNIQNSRDLICIHNGSTIWPKT